MFTQTLLTIVQSWTHTLPAATCTIQLLDRITGLLTFLGMLLYNTCTGQSLPNPSGANASNSLINFWYNVRDGLLTQTQLLQSLVDQGFITHSELTALTNSVTNAFNLTIPPQPSAQNVITVLKIVLGSLSACQLQCDLRSQWALLFLLDFVTNPTHLCNTTDLDSLYCFLFNHGFKPSIVSNIDDPTIVRLLPRPTETPCNPCAPPKQSDHTPSKSDFCDTDIAWLSNHTSGVQHKVHQRIKKDEPCIFPKAANLVLSFLAKDAKTVIQDPCENLNWCELRCILKKMLVVTMFTGQKNSQYMCKNTNNNGGNKIW
ncbi:MAG: hypothetical protein AAB323_00945 [Pseudomonadota bacterium]|mgnify:CR=1 FL=1